MAVVTLSRRRLRGHSAIARQTGRAGLAMVLPAFVLLMLLSLIPILLAFWLSFTNYDLIRFPKLIGFGNYARLAQDGAFLNGVVRTVSYVLLIVPAGTFLSLLIAVLLNSRLRSIPFFRTVVFLPQAISWVATALIWSWLYNPVYGIFNHLLAYVGLGPYAWTTDFNLALPSIVLMSIWRDLGYFGIILLAALQGIPVELYEAAALDGANRVATFWRITVPLLGPALFFVIVTWTAGAMQMFTQSFVLTNGGPVDATTTVVYNIYLTAFQFLKMGYASSQAFVLFLGIVLLTLLNRQLFRDQTYDV